MAFHLQGRGAKAGCLGQRHEKGTAKHMQPNSRLLKSKGGLESRRHHLVHFPCGTAASCREGARSNPASGRSWWTGVVRELVAQVDEWWLTYRHFVQKNAKRPPVHGQAVPLVQDQFGRHVRKRAHNRVTALRDNLAVAEACQLEMPAHINQEVLGFEVAVRNASGVQVL
eukprot:scaffold56535_cov29-Tisochrysis_lutea.AAC.1